MSDYNKSPVGLQVIPKKEWAKLFFTYCLEPCESRQVRGDFGPWGKTSFDLRMFDIRTFNGDKLGVAVMDDFLKKKIRFCKYGTDEAWKTFRAQFAAQFAGDNS